MFTLTVVAAGGRRAQLGLAAGAPVPEAEVAALLAVALGLPRGSLASGAALVAPSARAVSLATLCAAPAVLAGLAAEEWTLVGADSPPPPAPGAPAAARVDVEPPPAPPAQQQTAGEWSEAAADAWMDEAEAWTAGIEAEREAAADAWMDEAEEWAEAAQWMSSEGRGRPLTAPPSDKAMGARRPRPARKEGRGRPLTAAPSDKSYGGRRQRPARAEGRGRPASASSPSSGRPATAAGRPRTAGGDVTGGGVDGAELVEAWSRPGEPRTFGLGGL